MEQLFEVAKRFDAALADTDIEYRVVGGLAVFLHVRECDPLAARLTRDIDVAVDRKDLERIAEVARTQDLEYLHDAGADLLVDAVRPTARSAIHLVFVGEKVREEYLEPVPEFSSPFRSVAGLLIAPVADLVRMKLTSFRLKDQVHVQDMDSVGLITSEIEASLSPELRDRLAQVRAAD